MKEKKKTTQQNHPSAAPKKKKHTGFFLCFLVLILLVGAAAGYYFYERQKPQKAAEEFMKTVQTLDFDGMTAMLQTEDLSLLDDADIRNSVYTDFFRSMCEKISYQVVKNNFNLMSGTADVTVRINYPDGSDIYRTASSEFLRQVAAASFSGNSSTEKELEQILAAALMNAKDNTEITSLITEVTFPMISLDKVWKVARIDNEVLKVMSSNFSSVEQEFEESFQAVQNGKQVSMQTAVKDTDLIDMDNERFRIHYTQFRITKDISGQDCLLVYYEYTNNGASSSCPMIDLNLQAFQNDVSLEAAIPETTEDALDLYMSEIGSQKTVTVCQAFSLTDTSDVTLRANDAFTFGGESTSQLLKLQ